MQTCSNLFKLVQTCPNLFIFTFLGEPDDNNGADEDEILVDGISRPRNSDSRNGEGLIIVGPVLIAPVPFWVPSEIDS